MRISTEWLSDYVVTPPADKLGHIFEMAGIGVEEQSGEGVFTLEITSNRGDWLSALGLAREIAAMTGERFTPPVPGDASLNIAPGPLQVTIEAPGDCPRYLGIILENVQLGTSPEWMQQRLSACGMRPINNIVDITNYVMLETGQPLHAFDADRVANQHIVVRRARPGEKLETLDESLRDLDEQMLVIADPRRPLAIAGVMGGRDSEVGPATRRVLLEAAHFMPERVQYTAKTLGFATEASRRFERWVDPSGTRRAAARAVELFQQYAHANLAGGPVDCYPAPVAETEVTLRAARCNAVLGLHLGAETMEKLLQRLGLRVIERSSDLLRVSAPTWRQDITREVDLIEEVARLHGYDEIPSTLPRGANPAAGRPLQQRLEQAACHALLRCGLQEVVSVSLENAAEVARASLRDAAPPAVALRNPVTEDFTQLRTSLIPSLLRTLEHNARRHVAVYESGKVYLPRIGQNQPLETRRLGIALLDAPETPHWQAVARPCDFFLLKAVIERVCDAIGAPAPLLRATESDSFHPGRCATVTIDGEDVAVLGEVHPTVAARYDLKHRAYVAEIDFDALVRHVSLLRRYTPLPRFPAAERDLALIVAQATPAAEVKRTIIAAAGPMLEDAALFDVYTGRPIAEGSVSLTFALRFRAPDRTLTDDEVQTTMSAIIASVEQHLGARLRE